MSVDIDKFIVSTPGVVGGRPRIDGTRLSIMRVATWWQMGESAEEIVNKFDVGYLNLAQVYAALAYYHANKEKIDAEIVAEEAEYNRLAEEACLAKNKKAANVAL